ncbi:hypothetical protein [Aeromicrobium sp. IC_218]|uniref:hypothetical protein n=1 Tax=Aeromicrobium sp. IC_218 TaxID=2545468 RepID=UPI00103D9617|nr:hypothetical protein [Aeromicrobium sp. IC_218]TCI99197.1 hypothetical protein E0W78_08355 [Aeromicrobium sp. IC_218]
MLELAVAVLATGVAAVLLVVLLAGDDKRRQPAAGPDATPSPSPATSEDPQVRRRELVVAQRELDTLLRAGAELLLPTGNPDEYVVVTAVRTSAHGQSGIAVPEGLARSVADVSPALRGAYEGMPTTVRLVVLDSLEATGVAAATTVARTRGRVLGVITRDGRIASVPQLGEIGAGTGTSRDAAYVLSALSLLVEMTGLEQKLGELVDVTTWMPHPAQVELRESVRNHLGIIERVYEPVRGLEQLPDGTWGLLAPHLDQAVQDQAAARADVEELVTQGAEDSPFWAEPNPERVELLLQDLASAMETLRAADRVVLQVLVVRLWHHALENREVVGVLRDQARRELAEQRDREDAAHAVLARLLEHVAEPPDVARTFPWLARESEDAQAAATVEAAEQVLSHREQIGQWLASRAPLDVPPPTDDKDDRRSR